MNLSLLYLTLNFTFLNGISFLPQFNEMTSPRTTDITSQNFPFLDIFAFESWALLSSSLSSWLHRLWSYTWLCNIYFPCLKIPAPDARAATPCKVHNSIGQFRKVLSQFSELVALSFAQPCIAMRGCADQPTCSECGSKVGS